MDVKSSTARLRRAFAYPTDESSTDSQPEAMDEEEQEKLIETLAAQNTARNGQFRRLLLAAPLLSTIPYLLALLRRPTFLPALLGLTSLLSTAYLLHAQDPTETGIAPLDRWSRRRRAGDSDSGSGRGQHEQEEEEEEEEQDDDDDGQRWVAHAHGRGRGHGRRRRRRASSFTLDPDRRSPLETYLPLLNAGLCAVLVATGAFVRAGPGELALLPALVYGVVLVAKVVMAGVDPERELAALRYEAKGA